MAVEIRIWPLGIFLAQVKKIPMGKEGQGKVLTNPAWAAFRAKGTPGGGSRRRAFVLAASALSRAASAEEQEEQEEQEASAQEDDEVLDPAPLDRQGKCATEKEYVHKQKQRSKSLTRRAIKWEKEEQKRWEEVMRKKRVAWAQKKREEREEKEAREEQEALAQELRAREEQEALAQELRATLARVASAQVDVESPVLRRSAQPAVRVVEQMCVSNKNVLKRHLYGKTRVTAVCLYSACPPKMSSRSISMGRHARL